MNIPIRRLLGLLGVSFALHEAEEWNIVAWERAHFAPPPQFDDLGARTLLVAFAFLGLSFTVLCVRLLSARGAVVALLPLFVTVALGNGLTHVFWLLYFGGYAPGVLTSAFLLVPLASWLVYRVLRERLAPRSYLAALVALALVQPLGAAAAGASLSEPQLALQRFGMRLARWLWGAG
jgi:hypothetical protein